MNDVGGGAQPPHACPDMVRALEDDDVPIVYWDNVREYGVRILDGGTSILVVRFCPWCGAPLPTSLRSKRADELEREGSSPLAQDLPAEFRTGAWWRRRGL